MHIRTAVLAALVAAGPAVALAQVTPSASPAPATTEAAPQAALAALPAPVAAAAPAEQPPKWTIGAGVGNLFILSSVSTSALGLFASTPGATFFLERRVGQRTWLLFTGFASVSRSRADSPQSSGILAGWTTHSDLESASGAIGLRRVVTGAGAVMDVSLYATVGGGSSHSESKFEDTTGAVTTSTGRIAFATAEGGIAVERELTGGLAVRLSTPLVGASWSKFHQQDGLGPRNGSSASVFVTVSPRLELRLAF